MPAINVARTDTFEIQRQKINNISTQVFNVTSGGSDLSTGNLKLGNGTISSPSLSFDSENTLGFYRKSQGIIGYVSNDKLLYELEDSGFLSYRDFVFRKTELFTEGLVINSGGQNYDPGTYNQISAIGGTGQSGILSLTVDDFVGTSSSSTNYTPGNFSNIPTTGGSTSTRSFVSFTVDPIVVDITNAGSGYTDGSYTGVSLTGGTGTNATADITVSGGISYSGSIAAGSGYTEGVYSNVNLRNQAKQTFVVTKQLGDYFIDGSQQPVLNFEAASTYRFDLSDPSVDDSLIIRGAGGVGTPPSGITTISVGTVGQAGAFVDVIVESGYSLTTASYIGIANTAGADINFTTGTPQQFGTGASADVTVNNTGNISAITFTSIGSNYQATDVLEIPPVTIGAGTSGGYTINSINPNGTITALTIVNSGQNYIQNDVLSVAAADVGSTGSNASFTITSQPGILRNFTFNNAANDYLANDIISLPATQTGVTTTLVGSDGGNTDPELTFTVSDVSLIVPGSVVTLTAGTGSLGSGETLVEAIDYDANSITINNNPATSGSGTLTFTPPYGTPTSAFTYTINNIGVVSSVSVSNGGIGYFEDDLISVTNTDLVQPISYTARVIDLQELTFGASTIPSGTFTTSQSIKLRDGTPVSSNLTSSTTLTPNTVGPLSATLTTTTNLTTVSNAAGIAIGYRVTSTGTGSVGPNITVTGVNLGTGEITLSANPIASGLANLTFTEDKTATYSGVATTTNSANGINETLNISRNAEGVISSVVIVGSGFFYAAGDTLTIAGNLVGGSSPADDAVVTIDDVSETTSAQVREVTESGGFTTSLLVDVGGFGNTSQFIVVGTTTPIYTALTATGSAERFGFTIDTGSGPVYNPNLTLLEGNSYTFNIGDASISPLDFQLSQFPGGIWGNSFIENVNATLVAGSTSINVGSSTGIIQGMRLSLVSGDGSLQSDTKVVSIVDGSNITVDKSPTANGSCVLNFRGYAYENGVSLGTSGLTIKVLSDTPTLYYYANNSSNVNYANIGGSPGNEATLTVDTNNPKVFGSGLEIQVSTISSIDIIKNEISEGRITANAITAVTGNVTTLTSTTGNITSITANSLTLSTLNTTNLNVIGSSVSFTSPDVNIGTNVSITNSSGNITTSGVLRSNNQINSNGLLTISNATISTLGSEDLLFSPASNRVAKVTGTTAFVIPSGDSSQRPISPIAQNGAIRFNTESNQYEGYSAASSSWSSLGGVRDLDGNTYIVAEETVGANDNTLYFYNDNNNTIKLTPNSLDFNTVKKIKSINISAPNSTEWAANTTISDGTFIKYKKNIYIVPVGGSGTTGTTAPTHTTGTETNGTAQLEWNVTAVSELSFEEISEVRIGATDDTPLVISQDLRLTGNSISTDIGDLVLRPNSGQKLKVDATSSLVIPVGDQNQKGSAEVGSIRFNTSDTIFEGYDGSNWGSLGGVKDIDQDTFIKPEISPGSDEDTLYFFNAGTETVTLNTNGFTFSSIDTINVSGETLNIETQNFVLENNSLTILNGDGANSDRSFIFTSREFLDLGVSSGVNNDAILRLDDQGDVFFNLGFGTGIYNGVKIFDTELKEFELSDYKILTKDLSFTVGTVDTGAVVLYDPSIAIGCKVTVAALNITSGEKEIVEFTVVNNGSDISYTDFGNVKTGIDQFTSVFDIDAGNNVRLTITSASGLTTGDNVIVTTTTNIYKR
jgi:hypothetical protein